MTSDPQGSVDRDTSSTGFTLSRLRAASLAVSDATLCMARRRSAPFHRKKGHHYYGESVNRKPMGTSTTNLVVNVVDVQAGLVRHILFTVA